MFGVHYSVKLLTAPTAEPVSVTEVKDFLKIEHTDSDSLISKQIKASREAAESHTHRAFVTQTWVLKLDKFPSDEIIIVPRPPLISVTTIKYTDTDGAQQTLASTEYTVDNDSTPGRIVPAFGKSWPGIRDVVKSVEIKFIAGYGNADAVPEGVKSAIKTRIGETHEHRTETIIGATVNPVPVAFENLLGPYRVLDAA